MKRKAARSSSKAPEDFKRLKAKVGKRAPKPANYTDTTFQTASVKVRSQQESIEKGGNTKLEQRQQEEQHTGQAPPTLLISSRGNTLDSLVFQLLHHHAPAARISALRGIQDALNRLLSYGYDAARTIITANLSTLVPPLSKCFVDADDTVRSIGREILRFVFTILSSDVVVESTAAGDGKQNTRATNDVGSSVVEPFLPLYIAYISSAFNSLHDNIRQDATEGVVMASHFFSSGTSSPAALSSLEDFSLATKPKASIRTSHYQSIIIGRLLPSYVRLLATSSASASNTSQRSHQATSMKKGNKAKKTKAAKDKVTVSAADAKAMTQRCQILNSLLSLLKWNSGVYTTTVTTDTNISSSDGNANKKIQAPLQSQLSSWSTYPMDDLVFVPNGTKSNAILINRGARTVQHSNDLLPASSEKTASSHIVSPVTNLTDLFSCPFDDSTSFEDAEDFEEEQLGAKPNRSTKLPAQEKNSPTTLMDIGVISMETRVALLQCLLDCWVEVIQRGIAHGNGTSLSVVYLEEVSYLISCVRMFWCEFCWPGLSSSQHSAAAQQNNNKKIGNKTDERTKLRKVIEHMHTHMLEAFPIKDESGNPINAPMYNRINASICCLLGEIGGVVTTVQGTWVDNVFAYSIPRLNVEGDAGHGRGRRSGTIQAVDTACAMLDVVSLLILKSSTNGEYLLGERDRHSLLNKFGEVFFLRQGFCGTHESGDCVDAEAVASSVAGRKATLLLCDLILENQAYHGLGDVELDATARELVRMAFAFPHLLKLLGTNHTFESARILLTLKFMTQRWPLHLDHNANQSTKDISGFLWHLRKEMIGILSSSKLAEKMNALSIFERSPDFIQRLVIGQIGLLEAPSKEVTDALAQICARSCSAEGVEESIASNIFETMFAIRKSILMGSYLDFLVNSCALGTRKKKSADISDAFGCDFRTESVCRAILQTGCANILPYLNPVLLDCLQPKDSHNMMLSARSRAALTILLACAVDLDSTHEASLTKFVPELIRIVGPLICDTFLPLASSLEVPKRAEVMYPLLPLLRCEPELAEAFVSEALSRLTQPQDDTNVKRRLTENEVECLGTFLYTQIIGIIRNTALLESIKAVLEKNRQ